MMQSIFAGYFQHRLRPANVFPFISKIIKRFKFAGKIGVTHLLFRILPDQCSCNILNWEKQSTFIYERWSAIEHSLEPVPVVYHIPISISIYISSTALQIAQPPFLCRFPHTNFELCGVRSRNPHLNLLHCQLPHRGLSRQSCFKLPIFVLGFGILEQNLVKYADRSGWNFPVYI